MRTQHSNTRPAPRAGAIATCLLSCAFAFACDGHDWQARSVQDEGKLCFTPLTWEEDAAVERLEANAPLTIHVFSKHCLSGSCSRAHKAQCDLSVEGQEIKVSSHFGWEEQTGDDISCTLDCIILSAECKSAPLAAGNYNLSFGSQRQALTIPGDPPLSCPDALDMR